MKLEFLDRSKRARLLAGRVIAGHFIRAGFIFNGANIPVWVAPLVWLTRWHPKIRRAACIHDYLWSVGDLADNPDDARNNYRRGNEVFRDVLKKDGCNAWQVFACYNAVRLSGWFRLRAKIKRQRRWARISEV